MNNFLEEYIKEFDMNDFDISQKYYHSYRVMKNSIFLAEKLNLNEEDTYLAKLIGLYHDIGRFMQDKLYDSYKDTKEFDHGEYGADLLFKEGKIKEIEVEEKYYNIIEKAIRNHNKYEIEEGLNEKELLHAKIIRDADKMDIIYEVAEKLMAKKTQDYDDETFEIREEVKKEFKKRKPLKVGKKTNSEKVLSHLALIYNLYFKESAKYIKEEGLLEDFYNSLAIKENYKEYFDEINNYLEEMIKC